MYLLTKKGAQNNRVAVMKQKKAVSKGRSHFFFRHFFLKAFTLVLTLMNRGPMQPPIIPRIMAPGSM